MRNELVAAHRSGDAETEKELISDWQRKLRRLMAEHPKLISELQHLQDEWSQHLPEAERVRVQGIQQVAVATRGGTVDQAGRDQRIVGR